MNLELCDKCWLPIEGESRKVKKRGDPVYLHPECWQDVLAERERSKAETAELRMRRIDVGLIGVPEVPWTKASELHGRVHPVLYRFARYHDPREHGSALLLGPSGAGKTTAAAILVRRLARLALEATVGADSHWMARVKWIEAHSLVRARQEWPLGKGEPQVVERCKEASLLILDEVGFEPSNEILWDVVNARYKARLPTIATSGNGSTAAEFATRYGDAFVRRLSGRDVGEVIDAHEVKQ